MSTLYGFYTKRLKKIPTSADDVLCTIPANPNPQEWPQAGLWRIKQRDRWAPFQIYAVDGTESAVREWSDGCEIRGAIDGTILTELSLCERWLTGAIAVVSKEEWQRYHVGERKGLWDGELSSDGAAIGIGHNSASSGNLLEQAKEAIAFQREWLTKVGVVDVKTGNEAANREDRIVKLRQALDDERKELVEPHLKAQREINGAYNPVIDALKTVTKELATARETWQRAEAKKAREIAEAAERAAREEAAKVGTPEAEIVIPKVIAAPILLGGQDGKRKGVRKAPASWVITDFEKVLAQVKTHPEVQAAVLKAATALARAGAQIDGLTKQQTEEDVA